MGIFGRKDHEEQSISAIDVGSVEDVLKSEDKPVEAKPEQSRLSSSRAENVATESDRSVRDPLPSIGRIVHYKNPNGKVSAAVITDLEDQSNGNREVQLCVLDKGGIHFINAEYSSQHAEGTWGWPKQL